MSNPRGPQVSTKEVMQKIKEAIEKRRTVSHSGGSPDNRETRTGNPEDDLFLEDTGLKKRSDIGIAGNLLWKYGTRYAALVKKIPIIKTIAEKYYWKLARGNISRNDATTASLRPSNSGFDFPGSTLHYDGFLQQIRKEGLKGRIKLAIFNFIGFFAPLQGQVNRSLYEALAKQEAQTAARNKIIEGLEYKLSVLSKAEDALYEELTSQRAEIARQGRELMRRGNKQIVDSIGESKADRGET